MRHSVLIDVSARVSIKQRCDDLIAFELQILPSLLFGLSAYREVSALYYVKSSISEIDPVVTCKLLYHTRVNMLIDSDKFAYFSVCVSIVPKYNLD